MLADVFEVVGGPCRQQCDEVWVQGDVAVVAELADWDAEPVVVADADDGVGVEVAELRWRAPGARQELHHEPVAWVG